MPITKLQLQEFTPLIQAEDEPHTEEEITSEDQVQEEFAAEEFAPKLLTEDEVATLVEAAKNEGYQKAKEDLELEYHTKVTEALSEIQGLKEYSESIQQQLTADLDKINSGFIELIKILLEKLTVNRSDFILKLLKDAIEDNMAKIKAIPEIQFKLNTNVAGIKNEIEELMKGYEISNFSISIEECRSEVTISWSSGGLTIDTARIINQVEELLKSDLDNEAPN